MNTKSPAVGAAPQQPVKEPDHGEEVQKGRSGLLTNRSPRTRWLRGDHPPEYYCEWTHTWVGRVDS